MKMSEKAQRRLAESKSVFLRFPARGDAVEFIALSKLSRRFHSGLVKPPTDLKAFDEYLERNKSDSDECLLICVKDPEGIAGAINLSQIFHKGFKNAYLGYYLFEGFTGKGFMAEALDLAVKYAFTDLELHRLEANIRPENKASIAVVKRFGFVKEGYSRKYLKIGGKWRDHERWAIIKEDWIERRKPQK